LKPSYDVLVVGGGPAGVAAALKCVKNGFTVLMVEKGEKGRLKPCGGLLTPPAVHILREELRLTIPSWVICQPQTLNLYYLASDGVGGLVKGYRLLNVDRALFDRWLVEEAEEAGVETLFKASFTGLSRDGSALVKGLGEVKASFLVGADGVYSTVRRKLYGSLKRGLALILQEYYEGEGCFEDYFYMILNSRITPLYSYVIPKGRFHIVGTGVPKGFSLLDAASRFKSLLKEVFGFKAAALIRREAWAIPQGFTVRGLGNTVLVGDAAGFCNAFSGEGIRLALESGLMAAEAIAESSSSGRPLTSSYFDRVQWIKDYVKATYKLAASFIGGSHEEAVKRQKELVEMELARTYHWDLKV